MYFSLHLYIPSFLLLRIDSLVGWVLPSLQHVDTFRVTNVTKYRSFQYRLLQRGLVTNIQLSKWGILDSDKCTFCQEDSETVIHIFCECKCVRPIWDALKEYVFDRFQENIRLEPSRIILNEIAPKKGSVINFLFTDKDARKKSYALAI